MPGIYIYGAGVVQRARELKPSARGELEITDLNRTYLSEGTLRAVPMGRGIAWLDTGTPESLLSAGNLVQTIETRQGLFIGSPEEAAYRMGFLTSTQFNSRIEALPNGPYKDDLLRLARELT